MFHSLFPFVYDMTMRRLCSAMVSSTPWSTESQSGNQTKKEPKSYPPETYRFNASWDTAEDFVIQVGVVSSLTWHSVYHKFTALGTTNWWLVFLPSIDEIMTCSLTVCWQSRQQLSKSQLSHRHTAGGRTDQQNIIYYYSICWLAHPTSACSFTVQQLFQHVARTDLLLMVSNVG